MTLESARNLKASEKKSGDGGGPTDLMEQRIAALERGQELIISKLDGIAKGIADGRLENEKRFGTIESRLTGIEKGLDSKASAADLRELSGRVASIPTTWQTIAIISALLIGIATVSFSVARFWPDPAPAKPATASTP